MCGVQRGRARYACAGQRWGWRREWRGPSQQSPQARKPIFCGEKEQRLLSCGCVAQGQDSRCPEQQGLFCTVMLGLIKGSGSARPDWPRTGLPAPREPVCVRLPASCHGDGVCRAGVKMGFRRCLAFCVDVHERRRGCPAYLILSLERGSERRMMLFGPLGDVR